MDARQIFIFTILLGFVIIAAHVDAAQFEGSNIKLPREKINDSEKEADQIVKHAQTTSTLQNATKMNQAPIATLTTLNVEVESDVYSEKDRQVLYCPKGNYMVVRNRIYLTGVDLDKVKQVKYLLHPSFSNPVAVSEDATNSFEAWIWSWGGFPIKATITTKSGQVFEKEFDFSFKTKFEEAQSKGIPQKMSCEE
jgi:transcription initiation factor IIF auxiliary subunit